MADSKKKRLKIKKELLKSTYLLFPPNNYHLTVILNHIFPYVDYTVFFCREQLLKAPSFMIHLVK